MPALSQRYTTDEINCLPYDKRQSNSIQYRWTWQLAGWSAWCLSRGHRRQWEQEAAKPHCVHMTWIAMAQHTLSRHWWPPGSIHPALESMAYTQKKSERKEIMNSITRNTCKTRWRICECQKASWARASLGRQAQIQSKAWKWTPQSLSSQWAYSGSSQSTIDT